MKKLFVAAAAAILLSAGNASATSVTKITFSFKVQGTAHTCTMDVTRTNDADKGYITSDILLHAKSDDCQFVGDGTIGKLALNVAPAARSGNVATLIVIPTDYPNLIVLLKLNSEAQFQSGNGYYVYGWEDFAATYKSLGKGKYTAVAE